MTVLEAHGVGVAWAAAMPVVKDVTFVLSPGFYGLVGANGAGKTTLLRVLAGVLTPHEGVVRLRPSDARVVYCPQAVDEPSSDVLEFAVAQDGLAAALKGRLTLKDCALDRWDTLSPGERKRWQIGAALAREPDVLLLDEPTNHLDGYARECLLGALARFRGICVVVSHDRALLEALSRATLRVHDAVVTIHPGPWSEAREVWEAQRRQQEEAHAQGKAQVRALSRRVDEAQRTQQAAARSIQAKSRMKNARDHDARSMGRKVVASWADARASRNVRIVRDELIRVEARIPHVTRDVTLGGKIFASYERAPQPLLFHLESTELYAGEHVVLRDLRIHIGREERVRIAGHNGAGKTTLLSALLASKPQQERLLHVPQELSPGTVAQLVAKLHALSKEERGRVLSVFSALGSDPERILARRAEDQAALSPGEARKLLLAYGLGRHAWALLLDEPTNHLDLPTIERLEHALVGYPGCIVLITHDDAFARAVTTRTVHLESGALSDARAEP